MTETSPVITASSIHDSFINRTKTIGKPLDYIECKVVDEQYRLVPFNTVTGFNSNKAKLKMFYLFLITRKPGQLLTRCYNVMVGYWNDKEKTDETFTPDRFIKTGYFQMHTLVWFLKATCILLQRCCEHE
jgi:fatty-acyl-CoA synthase